MDRIRRWLEQAAFLGALRRRGLSSALKAYGGEVRGEGEIKSCKDGSVKKFKLHSKVTLEDSNDRNRTAGA
jgi:hypothetical protein